jgi:putative hemolysin
MKRLFTLTILIIFLGLTSCASPQTQPVVDPVSTATSQLNMPNPASVYCEQQGYISEIRTAADGSQTGYCIFPDGSECDEWDYFRGTCGFAGFTPQPTTEGVNGWRTYRNEVLGYSFQYPEDAQIMIAAEPQMSLIVSGSGMGGESWTISHPSDRDEFRPPENVDLFQWLTDHYLVGEKRMPDTQIAGTLAIHFRHERSPQSYADDRYYFAWGGQLYMVLIGHGETEDWELNNHFLQSIQFDENSSTASAPTVIPTALPIDPADYQGWWTYTHAVYNFSIMLSEEWVVEETTTFNPLMNGHTLILHPNYSDKEIIRMTFRRAGEDVPLWPTGVGAGEFIQQGMLDIAGQPALRWLLVCPNGDVTAIWYHQAEGQPNITRGDMEFGFIYSIGGHCDAGFSLSGKIQRVGEMIIASLKVP